MKIPTLPSILRFIANKADQHPRIGRNSTTARTVKPTYHRTSLFAGITKDLGELSSQIISDKGGPLLLELQKVSLELPTTLRQSRTAVPERLLEATVAQNLMGGRRSDLPLTAVEAREIAFMALGLSVDFDPNAKNFLEQFFSVFDETSTILAPISKEEALVLIEAYQTVQEVERAQILISDAFGRYGFDGDRELLCLQANNVLYFQQNEKLHISRSDSLREANIKEIFGTLAPIEFDGKLKLKNIWVDGSALKENETDQLISVLLTIHNGASTVRYALESILNQTWRSLEVIVIDDGSTDDTPNILRGIAARDARIAISTNPHPTGAYAARNQALKLANGAAITCHDADDWSHPQKIERQAKLLFEHPKTIASTSSWIRVTEGLEFTRKSRHKRYVQRNPSSLLFKSSAIARVGGWDEVTIGADTEFEERLKVVFGRNNVRHLNEVLSFGLDHSTSLSKDAVWRGWLSPDLDAYHRSFQYWHATIAAGRQKGAPLTAELISNSGRSFPAPAKYLKAERPSYFDVVMISDFRLYGGSVLSCVEEIKAQHKAGMTTAIHQVNCVTEDITGRTRFNSEIEKLINDGYCTLIGPDWSVKAGVCSIRFPPIFNYPPAALAAIDAKNYIFAVNTAPIEPSGEGRMYFIPTVSQNIEKVFGRQIKWHPIGPRIRDYIVNEVPSDLLADNDWVNILDVDDWIIPREGFVSDRPIVGRHSRDDKVKWPTDRKTLDVVYFRNRGWHIKLMGGAEVPREIYGNLPDNVTVLPFNGQPVKEFLRSLDFFVFFDDPQRVEAFGRVFIEAIAAGCCVILPKYYEPVFGDACLYAEPSEVAGLVSKLYSDLPTFLTHVSRAQQAVRAKWSYETHQERIRALL